MLLYPLPWYYAYSPRYEAFHWMFQDRIQSAYFELRPQFIEQSVFDNVTYREGSYHYLCGCFVKQERIYELLKTLPENSYFLYTDVDYHIQDLDKLWESLYALMVSGVDMAFQYEPQNKPIHVCNINVGFGLFHVNQRVRDYFAAVLKAAAGENVKNDLDIMTEYLPPLADSVAVIPPEVISMPYSPYKYNAALIPILCGNHGDYKKNLQEKYESLKSVNVPVQAYIAMALANGRTPEELGLV